VHSLKDIPTELPAGLELAATPPREDVRDVLIVRADCKIDPTRPTATLPREATIATSSSRRAAQLQALRPDLKIVPIRGNVGTRIKKILNQPELAGTILAAAGLNRLQFEISDNGALTGQDVPAGIKAFYLPIDEMLPAVGQAAIGIEIRANDPAISKLCANLNDPHTFVCVTAERAFLRAMGGACLSAVAAYATVADNQLHIRVVALKSTGLSRAETSGPIAEAQRLGADLAKRI